MLLEWIDWNTMSRSSVATKFNVDFMLVKGEAVAEWSKVLLVRENIQKPKSFRDM